MTRAEGHFGLRNAFNRFFDAIQFQCNDGYANNDGGGGAVVPFECGTSSVSLVMLMISVEEWLAFNTVSASRKKDCVENGLSSCHWSTKSIRGDSRSSCIEPLFGLSASKPFTIFSILFNSDGEFRIDFVGASFATTMVGDTEMGRCEFNGGEFVDCWWWFRIGRGLLLKLRGPVFDGVTASNADPEPDDGRLYGAKRLFEFVDNRLLLPDVTGLLLLLPLSACNGDICEWPE